jgi:hypothetical protein
VAQEIALLKGLSIEHVAQQTSQNFEDLFKRARPPVQNTLQSSSSFSLRT